MQKITDLTIKKQTNREERDINGNWVRKSVIADIKRRVKVISGGKRFAHYFIDLILFHIFYEVISRILLLFDISDSIGVLFIGFIHVNSMFIISYSLYYIIFEYFFQKSPGKFLTKSRVIDVYGNKPSISNIIIRSVIRLVPFEVFSCLSDRGWHDRWSDTFVVPDEEAIKLKELLQNQQEN